MKNFTLLTAIMFLFLNVTLQSQDTIPNNNFESWNSNTSPANWNTVNNLLPAGSFACYQTSNCYEGSYALSMKTIDLGGMLVPAVASLGTVGMGFTEGGIPFSGRPESLKGYFKHPSNGDAVMLFIQFYKDGIEMGSGYWSTSDSVPEFTMFEVPIYFTAPVNPDTMNITMITDQNTMGSNMIIDALQFEYPPVNIEEVQDNSIHVYPNPCYDYVSVKTSNKINSIKIINLVGGIVMSEEVNGNTKKMNLGTLPEGIYILKLDSKNGSFTRKIIKK